MLTVFVAAVAFACIVSGAVAISGHRRYTAAQREQAPLLFRAHLVAWLVTTGLGLVALALVASGAVGTVVEFGFSFALLVLCLAVLEKQLARQLDADNSPFVQRLANLRSLFSGR